MIVNKKTIKLIFKLFLLIFLISKISSTPQALALEEDVFEQPILLEQDEKIEETDKEFNEPFLNKILKGTIEKDYNLDSTNGLLHDNLKAEFQKGIIKEANFQTNYIFNFTQSINEADSSLEFHPQLINVNTKGKFKSEKEGFNFLFDLTPNMHENFFHRLVLDAWIETKRIPNHTLMFGTSRPNVGFEGGQSPYLIPFVNRSQTARNFGNIRKTGVRLKGDYKYIDYDLGGYSSDTRYSEFMPGVETDLWVNFKPLAKFDNNNESKYGKLNIGAGWEAGRRNSTDFNVLNTALRYKYKNFKLISELQYADGSNGASGLTKKERWGYNVTLAYMLTKKIELLARYDYFDPDKKVSNNNSQEYSAGINYYLLGQSLRFILNYIYCKNDTKADSHKIIFATQILI